MNTERTIIITGSSGLIGSALVSHFSRQGFRVRAFQRHSPKTGDQAVSYQRFELQDVQDEGFAGADYLVHCAYRPVVSRQERESGINIDVEAAQKVLSLCRKHGIKMVFLSTLSAHAGAESYYARQKFQSEKLFDGGKDLVLKLGIVLGPGGGLFGRIVSSLRRNKIVPLVGGGRQYTQTIALDDLCRIIEIGIRNDITGMFKISHPKRILTKDLYRKMADAIGVRPWFVPVPLVLTYHILRLTETMGLKMPFTSENILGLKDLRAFDTAPDLERFGLTVKDCQTTLARLSSHL